ncbi:MAG TPA: PfkB family carbohydrate kinase [Nitrososphaera sp.]|nr:PfkB family carbohydrate kinase [Nitrososphaera sp.]
MRIGIASHLVLDTIEGADGSSAESVGGPPCYCGVTSRRFGFDVSLATRVGRDFPQEMHKILRDRDIIVSDRQVAAAPTTRFSLVSEGNSRRLVLSSKCEPLTAGEIQDMKVDCWIASPVIDEVPTDVLAAIKQHRGRKNFVMLDPQGYMRTVGNAGQVELKDKLDLDLSGITAIKVDSQEMSALTGGLQGLEGMQRLQSKGVEFVVSTEHRVIRLLYEKTHYWIKMRDIDTPDSTGAGDILCAAFCCAYLKEKDPLWAICFGAGAIRAALETGEFGLAKIPAMSKIEQSASYFYNTVGFQQLS